MPRLRSNASLYLSRGPYGVAHDASGFADTDASSLLFTIARKYLI